MSWTTQAAPSTSWSTVTYTEDAAMRSYRTNYITDSGELWNPRSWRNGSASTATDGTLAPDGTYATKLTRVDSNGNSVLQIISFLSDGTKTFSVHMKYGNTNTPYTLAYDSSNGLVYRYGGAWFGVSPPQILNNGGVGSWMTHPVQDAGDGWFRFGFSMSVVSYQHVNAFYCFPDNIGGNGSYTYFWGAQAEDGGSMTTYIPSTDTWGREVSTRWETPTTVSESWTTQAAP